MSRKLHLPEDIRQVISNALLFEMRDPSLAGVTVTRVKVSPDLQFADIRFSVMGADTNPKKVEAALNRARGAFKRELTKKIRMRRVPELRFHFDEDVASERRIGEILDQLDIPSDANEQALDRKPEQDES